MSDILEFEISRKNLVNSNDRLHPIVKSKITSYLRKLARDEGLKKHEDYERAIDRYNLKEEFDLWTAAKRKERKKMRQDEDFKSLKKKEFEAIVDQRTEYLKPKKLVSDMDVNFRYKRFDVKTVVIAPPRAKRLDAANLYPTTKALIDGLTDASWWEDDSQYFQRDNNFNFGGHTKEDGQYIIKLIITEVSDEDWEEYIQWIE